MLFFGQMLTPIVGWSIGALRFDDPPGIRARLAAPMDSSTIVMAVTANRFQISKVADVKAVLRNLHVSSTGPASKFSFLLAGFS